MICLSSFVPLLIGERLLLFLDFNSKCLDTSDLGLKISNMAERSEGIEYEKPKILIIQSEADDNSTRDVEGITTEHAGFSEDSSLPSAESFVNQEIQVSEIQAEKEYHLQTGVEEDLFPSAPKLLTIEDGKSEMVDPPLLPLEIDQQKELGDKEEDIHSRPVENNEEDLPAKDDPSKSHPAVEDHDSEGIDQVLQKLIETKIRFLIYLWR